jgi:hypothetical protein
MTRVMWSKGYKVTDAEVREPYNIVNRHDGGFYTAAAAGLVADHKAQRDRLDFGSLFKSYRDQFPAIKILLSITRSSFKRLPGGHLTTNEQPEALAALIAEFERGLVKMPEP